MKSRWSDHDANAAVAGWGAYSRELALRLYSARLLGADSQLVLHGGGNCSLKGQAENVLGEIEDVVFVKASGFDMAGLEPKGLPGLTLAPLLRLRQCAALTDEAMVNEFRRNLCDTSSPIPSVETLLHAFLPHRYIDHSHADALLAITNQPDGEALVREALGDQVAIVPYVRPGFALAKAAAEAFDHAPRVHGLVLMCHGLVTFGDDARTSYERHIELVDACERFVARRAKPGAAIELLAVSEPPHRRAAKVAPILRGLLAVETARPDRPRAAPILEWRASEEAMFGASCNFSKKWAISGPLTPDHVLRTKPHSLLVENPTWDDSTNLRRQVRESVEQFRQTYRTYVAEHGGPTGEVDPSPCVIFVPGVGLFAAGSTKRAASITADIAEHTIATKLRAESIGEFRSLPPRDLFDVEFWPLERAKLKGSVSKPLDRQIVVVSGGAGAIGVTIAESCVQAGAHVAMTDVDPARLRSASERLAERLDRTGFLAVPMDVTDENSVRSGYEEIVRTYGGVDVIVSNAGIAHVAPIDELELKDFSRVMDVNTLGGWLFMREGIRILKEQGIGGHVIINASKNVFAPGKDFAAYSASKAALHQLGKVAAIELAPHDIRVNMINADGIFGDEDCPSGLWKAVGPERANSRGLREEELPAFYQNRNLLKAKVTGRHIGNAVVFFASNATPTTGATLPIDGGLPEAFPR